MRSATAGWPCVSVPVLSKTMVSTSARRSIWRPLLMMMPRRAAQRHRGQHGGGRRDADAGAVIDDDQRQEAVEVGGERRGAAATPSVGSDQAVGEFFGVVLHARVADRRGIDQPHDLAGGGVGADARRAYRQLSFARHGRRERRFARRRASTGRPSPVMVFWSISALPSTISPSTGIISPG